MTRSLTESIAAATAMASKASSETSSTAPPTAAVLAAEQLAGRGLELLGRLQSAHYVEGRRIADEAVLIELAVGLGFESTAFTHTFKQVLANELPAHFKQSRALLAQVGGQGFPTLALEQEGRFSLIDMGPWLGKPDAFADWLKQSIGQSAAQSSAVNPSCGLHGCGPGN